MLRGTNIVHCLTITAWPTHSKCPSSSFRAYLTKIVRTEHKGYYVSLSLFSAKYCLLYLVLSSLQFPSSCHSLLFSFPLVTRASNAPNNVSWQLDQVNCADSHSKYWISHRHASWHPTNTPPNTPRNPPEISAPSLVHHHDTKEHIKRTIFFLLATKRHKKIQ